MITGGSDPGHETRRILRPAGPLYRSSAAGEHSGAWERPDTGRHREPSAYWIRAEYVARTANPWWRIAAAVLAVLILTAAIIAAAVHAGGAAADSFGPLIPAPTPAPGGWTP